MAHLRGLCLLIFISPVFCTKKPQDAPVLTVGSKVWNLSSYKNLLQLRINNISHLEKNSLESLEKIKESLTKELILNTLVEEWASTKGIKPYKNPTPSPASKNFYGQSFSLQDLKNHQKEVALYQALLEHLSKKIKAPPLSQQKKYYSKNRKKFRVPASCFLEQILVSSKGLAKDISLQLERGESFEKLKFLHSKKADVGWVYRGGLGVFDRACKTKTKSITPVLKSDYGFHIFKVIKKRASRQKRFSQVQKEIIETMTKTAKKALFQSWLKKEVSKTPIFINKKLLNNIRIQYKK